MKIGLIPLDERPVNTRYPRMIAEIAGGEVILPPHLSNFRTPAPPLQPWLESVAPDLDALIVSVEMLAYGGLIASRITDDSAAEVISRLDCLRTLRQQYPRLKIFGFNVITRISRHNDSTEEPLYWAEYGERMFHLSQLMDRAEQGQPVQRELDTLQAEIPTEYRTDFLTRRERNHQVNRHALELLAAGVFDLLVLSSDDTSPYGLGSREKRQLQAYAQTLQLGDKLLMYPGADEVGCVLLARLLLKKSPRFQSVYLIPDGEKVVASFEDCPIQTTVERQIHAAGGEIVTDKPDFVFYVNTPLAEDGEWVRDYTPSELAERLPHLQTALQHLPQKWWILADVAHANGSDAVLFDLLKKDMPPNLVSYAAWNTAGNTVGTVIAQACAVMIARQPNEASQRFLAHRFIEDWAYQRLIREEVREWLEKNTGRRDPLPEEVPQTAAWIEARLTEFLSRETWLKYRIKPKTLRLPWGRTFEIDFEVEDWFI